jgi:hypothetical protein
MKKLTAAEIYSIQELIDSIVEKEGFPVFRHMLVQHGVATKEQLKKLEKDGYLIEYPVTQKGAVMVCYYTPGKVPAKVAEREAQLVAYMEAENARQAFEASKELETLGAE